MYISLLMLQTIFKSFVLLKQFEKHQNIKALFNLNNVNLNIMHIQLFKYVLSDVCKLEVYCKEEQ